MIEPQLALEPRQGKLRARLYGQGVVQGESVDERGTICLSLRLPKEDFIRLLNEEGIDPSPYLQPPFTNTGNPTFKEIALP
jgi:GTP-binding protein HflX